MHSRRNAVISDTCKRFRQMIMCCGAVLLLAMLPSLAFAQETFSTGAEAGGPGPQVVERVAVTPVSSDPAIDRRLTRILEATGWFTELDVQVREQARNSRVPEAGGDLLEGGAGMMDAPDVTDATDGSGRPGASKADA